MSNHLKTLTPSSPALGLSEHRTGAAEDGKHDFPVLTIQLCTFSQGKFLKKKRCDIVKREEQH